MECTVRSAPAATATAASFESPQSPASSLSAAVPTPNSSLLMDNLVAEKLAQSTTQSRAMDGGGLGVGVGSGGLPLDGGVDTNKKISSSSSAGDVSLSSMLASLSQLSLGGGGGQELSLPPGVMNNPNMLAAVPGFCWSGVQPSDDQVALFNQSVYQNFPVLGGAATSSGGISLDQLHHQHQHQQLQHHQQASTSQWSSPALGYTAQPLPPPPTGGSSRTYPGWGSTSQLTLSVLAARNGLGGNRGGSGGGGVSQGRSMSVQNVNDPQTIRAPPAGYTSGGVSLAPLLAKQCSDRLVQESQRIERAGEASRISLVGGLSQLQDPNAAVFDAQWLDLIRIAASKESTKGIFQSDPLNAGKALDPNWTLAQSDGRITNKGRLPIGFLDNNLMRGDGSYLLDQFTARKLCFPSKSGLGSQPALNRVESYSRKVFVGGLPPDIDEDEIMAAFRHLGPLVVDWPHKSESKSYFPPKGYCFLLFQDELSVQALVDACFVEDGKLYWRVSSPTMKDKPVQIRPWNLADSDYVMDSTQPLDPRKTVFVGGVPRPLRAVELAIIMARLYGGVCYAGIDTDPELKYPKGAGRVSFSSQQSYIAAISARFVQLQLGDIDKRVEVKPYVLDDQICDECQGLHSAGKFAPFFCANVMCLQYYCEHCWSLIHSSPNREFHKPLVKEGADRPRALPFRWC